jgi:predicted negative regulator of RcsB-dependent stress response
MGKKLKSTSGEGYSYAPEKGVFEVKTDNIQKTFTSLSEARNYYDSINAEKAIWQLKPSIELLDAHSYE